MPEIPAYLCKVFCRGLSPPRMAPHGKASFFVIKKKHGSHYTCLLVDSQCVDILYIYNISWHLLIHFQHTSHLCISPKQRTTSLLSFQYQKRFFFWVLFSILLVFLLCDIFVMFFFCPLKSYSATSLFSIPAVWYFGLFFFACSNHILCGIFVLFFFCMLKSCPFIFFSHPPHPLFFTATAATPAASLAALAVATAFAG